MKVIETLGVYTTPKHQNDFLQHITEIGNIKVKKGDSYIDFFNALKVIYAEDEERLKAAIDFIEYNMQEVGEDVLRETVVNEDDDAYVVINVFNIKQQN